MYVYILLFMHMLFYYIWNFGTVIQKMTKGETFATNNLIQKYNKLKFH